MHCFEPFTISKNLIFGQFLTKSSERPRIETAGEGSFLINLLV